MNNMANSAGSAEAEMSVIMDSIDYKFNALKETGTGIAQNLFKQDDMKAIIELLTKLGESLDFVTDELGLFGTIGLGAGLFAGIKNVGIFKTISDETTISGQKIVGALQARKIAQQQATAQLEVDVACLKEYQIACQNGTVATEQFDTIMCNASASAIKYTAEIKAGTGSAQSYAVAQRATNSALQEVSIGAGIASKAVKLFSAALNMIAFTAIIQGVSWLIGKVDEWIVTAKEAEESATAFQESLSTFFSETQSNLKTISSLSDRFDELSKNVDANGKQINGTKEEYDEFLSICEQAGQIMPELITGYTNEGQAIIKLRDKADSLTESYKKAISTKAALFLSDGDDDGNTVKSFFDDYNNFVKGNGGILPPSSWASSLEDFEDYYGYEKIHEWLSDVTDATYEDLKNISRGSKEFGYLTKVLKESGYDLSKISIDNYNAIHDVLNNRNAVVEQGMTNRVTNIKTAFQDMLFADGDYWAIDDDNIISAINSVYASIDNEFIKQNNLFTETALQTFESNLISLFANDATKQAMLDFYTPQTDDETVTEYVDRIRESLQAIQSYCDENGIVIPIESPDIDTLETQYQNAIEYAKKNLKEESADLSEYQQNLQNEYQKVQDWGLGDYEQDIKNGTIQSIFGNVDMDKRTIISWSDKLKQTYQDELASWDYDPEIGSIDTVFGGSNRFGEGINGTGWEVAFTPILPDGTFLSRDTVYDYINSILEEAYANDGKVTEDELVKIDAQGRQIGNIFVQGIFAGIDDSQNYENNGNWAETVGRLMHFSGKFGAVDMAKQSIEDAKKNLQGDFDWGSWFDANSINTQEEIDRWQEIAQSANSAAEAREKYVEDTAAQNKETAASFSEVSEEIDDIQSAYDDLKSVKEQFDDDGYLSVDSMQTLLELGDDYLQYLIDENGQLNLNEQAFIDLAKAKIQNLMLSAVSEYNSWVQSLQDEGITAEELTDKYISLAVAKEFALGEIYSSYELEDGTVVDVTGTDQYKNLMNKMQLYKAAIDGLGKGGLSSSSSSSSSKKLDKLNESIKTNQLLLDKYSNIIDTLDTKLDMLSDNDYEGKIEATTDKISALSAQTAAMRNEFERLNAITPSTSDEAETLASQMESLHDSIVDNITSLRECYTEIENIKHEAFANLSEEQADKFTRSIETIERSLDNVQKKYTRNGSLDSFNMDLFLPDNPESAVENKRKEAEQLEAEEKKYYAAIEKIKLKAISEENTAVKNAQKIVEDSSNKATETVLGNIEKISNATAGYFRMLDNGVVSLDTVSSTNTTTTPSISKVPLNESAAANNVTGKTQGGTNCVNYARARVAEITGKSTSTALTSKSMAKTFGYNLAKRVTDTTSDEFKAALVPGAVISMNNGTATNSNGEKYGHVIVVEGYNAKTNTLTYSDSTTGIWAKSVNLTDFLKQKQITGIVPPSAYAEGTNYHMGGLALVGEDHKNGRKGGAELAQFPDGKFALLGTNGAELYNLPKGTKILSHDETKKIIPSYAEGVGDVQVSTTEELIDSLTSLIESISKGYTKEYAEYQAKATSAYAEYSNNISSVRSRYSSGELSRDEAMSLIEGYERGVTLSNYSLAFSSIGLEISRGNEELQAAIDYYNELIERSDNGELIDESVFENWRDTIYEIQERVQEAEDKWADIVDGMYDTFDTINRKLTATSTDIQTSNERLIELTENRLSGETDKSVLIKDSLTIMERQKEIADEARKSMDLLHSQADELRSSELGQTLASIYDTESWFNADGTLNSNFDKDWEFADEKTREMMAEYAQNMSSLKQQHGEWQDTEIDYLNKVKDLRSEIIGYAQEAFEDAYNKQVEAIEKANDSLDVQISKQQALLDAQKSCAEANKSLRDSFQEIEAELALSKALSDWLDPTTREGLFNESDYKKLSKTISSIKSNISDIYDWYEKQISALDEDDIYQQEYITEEFNRRLESEQNRYALAEKEVDLEKKKIALQNTLANKNEKMFVGGTWVSIANTQSVIDAQKDYQTAKLAYENQLEDNRQTAKFNQAQAKIDSMSVEKAKNEYDITLLQKVSDELSEKLEELISPTTDLAKALGALASSVDSKLIDSADILSTATVAADLIAPSFVTPKTDIDYQEMINQSNSDFFNYMAERERNQKIFDNLLTYEPTYNYSPPNLGMLSDIPERQEVIAQAITEAITNSGLGDEPRENYYIDKFNVKTDEPRLEGVLNSAKKYVKHS